MRPLLKMREPFGLENLLLVKRPEHGRATRMILRRRNMGIFQADLMRVTGIGWRWCTKNAEVEIVQEILRFRARFMPLGSQDQFYHRRYGDV